MFEGDWFLHHGDAIKHLHHMPESSMDFSIYSPPFPSVFAYTSLENDIGNSDDMAGETKLHFSFFFNAIRRVIKPGRVMIVHCTQIHRQKRNGEFGLYDFRGLLIRLAIRAGFIYDYDWVIRRNPQAQAIRTRKWELKFQGLEADRSVSRGAMPDYLIKFRAPGGNDVAVRDWDIVLDKDGDAASEKKQIHPNQVSRNEWIQWAECCWSDINETNTLNVKEGRGEDDVKHICPLQLDLIERCVRLYSNPGEIVFSPFAGIGSELVTALKLGRRAYGCELKDEYHAASIVNCERALRAREEKSKGLFDFVETEESNEPELAGSIEG